MTRPSATAQRARRLIRHGAVIPKADHLWRAHDAAQRHYEKDLDLFATRMNFFLTVDTAVAGLAATRPGTVGSQPVDSLYALGLLVSVAWLAVWGGSYRWITKWRGELVRLSGELKRATNVDTAAGKLLRTPDKWKWLTLLSRPTGIMLFLPLAYLRYWLVLLIRAMV